MMKRPTKAEKLSRQVNTPSAPARRDRSLSPDLHPSGPSVIPLFNTSAKRRGAAHPIAGLGAHEALVTTAREAEARRASDRERLEEAGMTVGEAEVEGAGRKKKGLKDKIRAAREEVAAGEERSGRKLGGKPERKKAGVLGGGECCVSACRGGGGGCAKLAGARARWARGRRLACRFKPATDRCYVLDFAVDYVKLHEKGLGKRKFR